jgi:magnesium transporter
MPRCGGCLVQPQLRTPDTARGNDMLRVYRDTGGFLASASTALPGEIIWMDLVNPTNDESHFVEARARVRVPSKEALSEIETSSRLVVESKTIYMSAPMVARGDTADAFLSPLGLILTKDVLVTVRFDETSASTLSWT